jgi:hypothetical protein
MRGERVDDIGNTPDRCCTWNEHLYFACYLQAIA